MDISLLVRTAVVTMTILAGLIVLRFSKQEDIKNLHQEVMQRHDIDDFYLVGEECDKCIEEDRQRQEEMALDSIITKAYMVQ